MAVDLVMPSAFRRIIVALMVGGALWVTVVAIRIETQNAAAGYYLPRRDEPGKWRISREDLARDQLRRLVSTLGVWQYIFSPLLIALASICVIRPNVSWQWWLGVVSGVVGLGALSLVFYRGYFSSLGL